MAKLFGTVMLIWLACIPGRVSAHDAYDDSESHPLRLAAYALHPVGFALEWLAMRPMHFVVSQPKLEPVLGTCRTRTPSGITSRISPSHPDARPRDRAGARRDNYLGSGHLGGARRRPTSAPIFLGRAVYPLPEGAREVCVVGVAEVECDVENLGVGLLQQRGRGREP